MAPQLHSSRDIDGSTIFPRPDGALEDHYYGFYEDIADYPRPIAQLVDEQRVNFTERAERVLPETGIKTLKKHGNSILSTG